MSRSRYTLAFDHHNMVPGPAGVATPHVIYKSEDGILQCYGITVPTDDAAGYAKGCLFYHTDGDINDKLYVNDGDADGCNFNLVAGEGLIQYGTHEITNAEVKLMNSANGGKGHEILAAPGTGKLISEIDLVVVHNYVTAAFSYAVPQVKIGDIVIGSGSRDLFEATSDHIMRSTQGSENEAATDLINKGLYLYATAVPATGGGTFSVRFAYRIYDFN